MSDPVAVAVISTIGSVLVAVVGVLAVIVGKIRRDTTATRDQVVNHHKTNMRDENDSRHAETLALFREVRKDIGGLRGDIRGVGDRVTSLEQLEITAPVRRKREK